MRWLGIECVKRTDSKFEVCMLKSLAMIFRTNQPSPTEEKIGLCGEFWSNALGLYLMLPNKVIYWKHAANNSHTSSIKKKNT